VVPLDTGGEVHPGAFPPTGIGTTRASPLGAVASLDTGGEVLRDTGGEVLRLSILDVLPPQPVRLFAAAVLTQLCILLLLGPVGHSLLKLQLCSSPDAFRSITVNWTPGSNELWHFKAHFILDAWYPLLYGLLLYRRAAAMLPRGVERTLLQQLAVLGAACDLVENSLHWSVVENLAGASDGIILSAAACAAVKWAVLAKVCWALHPWRAVGGGW